MFGEKISFNHVGEMNYVYTFLILIRKLPGNQNQCIANPEKLDDIL
jgi:hypothetical protein